MSKRFKLSLRNLFRSCRPSKHNLPSQPLLPSRRRPEKDASWHVLDEEGGAFIEAGPAGKQEPQRRATDTCLFSSSTDFSPHLETIREGPNIKHRPKRTVSRLSDDAIVDPPARLSAVFQRLMPCSVEGKVRESFAVVKRSDDPYEDFRRSMAEMIVEKEMVEEADLRQLLRCFLSLNSDHHHAVIIAAFSDISNAFFSTNSPY